MVHLNSEVETFGVCGWCLVDAMVMLICMCVVVVYTLSVWSHCAYMGMAYTGSSADSMVYW